jgi:hypothetical protein
MPACLRRWNGPAGIVVLAIVLSACSGGGARPGARSDPTSAVERAFAGSTRPYTLYTHCGIDEARIGSRYFEAVHPVSDGAGNPPAGWGNPSQQGTMTLLSQSTALFRDDAGHHVLFRLRPGATSFKRICE